MTNGQINNKNFIPLEDGNSVQCLSADIIVQAEINQYHILTFYNNVNVNLIELIARFILLSEKNPSNLELTSISSKLF